jgi:hypothetical protein
MAPAAPLAPGAIRPARRRSSTPRKQSCAKTALPGFPSRRWRGGPAPASQRFIAGGPTGRRFSSTSTSGSRTSGPFPIRERCAGTSSRFSTTSCWASGKIVYRSIIAEAQVDAGAAAALAAYHLERQAYAGRIIERAKARGEIDETVNSALAIDLVVSFAWHQLLIGRVEVAMGEIEAVVDIVLAGLAGYHKQN